MDFHSLTRRELQSLCKKNGIHANMTNVAMADALTALYPNVQGLEQISDSSMSVTAQSTVESPDRAEVMSPRVPRTRTTRKKVESSTVVNKATTTTRRVARNKKDGVAPINIEAQFSEADNQSQISKVKEACIPQTPAMVSATTKRSSKVETTTTNAYSTRRSTRLAAKMFGHTSVENKEIPDAANMKLFSADCGDNFEMNDNESCADLIEDVQSTDDGNLVSKLMDMSLTSKDGVISQIKDLDGGILVPKVNDVMLAEAENPAISDSIVDESVPLSGEEEHVLDKVAAAEQVDKIDWGQQYSKEDEFLPKSEVEDILAETGNHDVSVEERVVDDSVPLSEEECVVVKAASVEHVDKIDCNKPSHEYCKEDEILPKSEVEDLVNGSLLAESENQVVTEDEFVPMSEEKCVVVKAAAVEQVDNIDCNEPSHEYSKEDEFLPKSEVEDLVNGSLLAETENQAVSDSIVVDVPMSEEEVHVPSQEYSKEDELLPKSGLEDIVNVAPGKQLVNSEGEFLFDSMLSDEEKEEDLVNVEVGKQLVNGENGKPSQQNSKDDEFSSKSFSMEDSSEEEGSEDESEEGSEDESEEESEEDLVNVEVGKQLVNGESGKPSQQNSKDDEFSSKSFKMEESSEEEGSEDESEEGSEDESEDDESEDDSEEEDLVYDAVGGQFVNCGSDKPSELISKEELPKSLSMEEYKEEEVSKDESEEVEDLVKAAAGAQLDYKPSENPEKDVSSKASIFVDDSEGILLLPAMTANPTPGNKNTNAVVTGKENLENFSMRQIRKMIKGLNINADSKTDKDNLVKKSDEELVETASIRPALQMLPENQN